MSVQHTQTHRHTRKKKAPSQIMDGILINLVIERNQIYIILVPFLINCKGKVKVMMDIEPLNISVTRAPINGHMYYVYDYQSYVENQELVKAEKSAVIIERDGKKYYMPYKGEYESQISPGIYDAGAVDFVIYPEEAIEESYMPKDIINYSNMDSAKEILNKQKMAI